MPAAGGGCQGEPAQETAAAVSPLIPGTAQGPGSRLQTPAAWGGPAQGLAVAPGRLLLLSEASVSSAGAVHRVLSGASGRLLRRLPRVSFI